MRSVIAAAVLTLAVACGSDAGPAERYQATDDGVSFARVADWSIRRERATLLLTKSGDPATIAIRVTPRAGWSEPRDQRNVFPAVARVLEGLPAAQVSGPADVPSVDRPAAAYEVDFTPPGPKRARYHRRHVTILSDHKIIHVFVTGPAGLLVSSRDAFDTIVKTIREEA